MTTAHRPTYKAAVAKFDQGNNHMLGRSQQVSKEDMPHHLTTKYRQKGQNREDELDREEMKKKLQDKEDKHYKRAARDKPVNNREAIANKKEDDDEGGISGDEKNFESIDKDDSDSDKDSDISGDDDSDDETAELMRELEKIKKERAIEEEKKAREQAMKDEKEKNESILTGNPLLGKGGGDGIAMGSLKRRWDDDVVFKNQTRGEPVKKKKFVNDTIRSDFHRKFLGKYIK